MTWRRTGKDGGQETTIVIGGLLSVSITITRTSWRVEGSHGRHLDGTAASVGSAKEQALKALQSALNSDVIDVESMLRVGLTMKIWTDPQRITLELDALDLELAEGIHDRSVSIHRLAR